MTWNFNKLGYFNSEIEKKKNVLLREIRYFRSLPSKQDHLLSGVMVVDLNCAQFNYFALFELIYCHSYSLTILSLPIKVGD